MYKHCTKLCVIFPFFAALIVSSAGDYCDTFSVDMRMWNLQEEEEHTEQWKKENKLYVISL